MSVLEPSLGSGTPEGKSAVTPGGTKARRAGGKLFR